MKWYSMLQNKYPPQMEVISKYEVNMGIRELSEGNHLFALIHSSISD